MCWNPWRAKAPQQLRQQNEMGLKKQALFHVCRQTGMRENVKHSQNGPFASE
jgi:hypothetical protein